MNELKLLTPESSQVVSLEYKPETEELQVEFKSGTYVYQSVPKEIGLAALKVKSVGSFLNAEVKPKYKVIKL